MTEWIKCTDRLPEIGQSVLAIDKDNYFKIVTLWKYSSNSLPLWAYHNDRDDEEPTHWMPLPDLPEVNDE